MKTLQDALDTLDQYMDASEKDHGKDPDRNQELTYLLEHYEKLGEVTRLARGQGIVVHDAEAVQKIPRVTHRNKPEHFFKVPLAWMCQKGHYFKRSLGEMEDSLIVSDNPCRICARVSARGVADSALEAKVKLVLQHDERGEDLHYDNYVNANEQHTYISRCDGESYVARPKNVGVWARVWDRGPKDVWIAEDGESAFLWCGARPVVENPILKNLMEHPDTTLEPYYNDEDRHKKGYTHRSGLERAIIECGEAGAKVLNVSLNPQYKAPGVYTWGNLREEDAALAAWINEIEKKWIDVAHAP